MCKVLNPTHHPNQGWHFIRKTDWLRLTHGILSHLLSNDVWISLFFASLPGFPVLAPGQPASTSQHSSLVLGPTSSKAPWSLCLSTPRVLPAAGLDPAWMGCFGGREAYLKLIWWEPLAAAITSSVTPLQLLNMLPEMVKSTDKRVFGNLSTFQPNLNTLNIHLGVY